MDIRIEMLELITICFTIVVICFIKSKVRRY